MASQASIALPWAWVIEALAGFKEVEASTLIDLIKRSPIISNDIGINAREIVSFRTLERLFDPEAGRTQLVSSAANLKLSFDCSERCEDVLKRVMEEMSGSNKWDESEKSKWNVQPFIAYKRSSLLECNLQKLKNIIVGDRQLCLPSLKQRSLDNRQLSPCNNDRVSEHADKEVDGNSECFNDGKQQDDSSEEMKTLDGESGENVEDISDFELSNDCGWYREEMNYIATKKQAFFSSKCWPREVVMHRKGANHCMKCNKGGQLLVCSSNGCSFVFHASCLGSTSTYDNDLTKKFYCPFCRYSQSVSDYWVAKKETSLARKNLVSFNSSTTEHRSEKFPKRLRVSEQNVSRQDKDSDDINVGSSISERNFVIQVSTRDRGNTEDLEQKHPSAVLVTNDNNPPCGKEGKFLTNGTNLVSLVNKRKKEKTGPRDQTKRMNEQQIIAQPVCESHAVSQILDGVSDLAVPDSPNEISESSGAEGRHEESSEEADYRDHSLRSREVVKRCTYVHVPRRRRVPVPWTQLEEETLKKGVQKFSSARTMHDRGVPWRKILEFGTSVFQRGRTPGDLKDKWRNMCKASSTNAK